MAKRGPKPKPKLPPEVPVQPDPALAALSADEIRFVDEYMIDLNGTRAYRAVQPLADYRTALQQSRNIRRRPHVQAEIRARKFDNRIRCQVRADAVLRELARVAMSDILDLYGPDSRLLTIRQIPLDTRRAVKSVKVRRERTRTDRTVTRAGKSTITTDVTIHECEIEIVMHDKVAALDKLCRYLGLDESIPPLDRLLDALPMDLAFAVRQRLALTEAPPALPAAGQTQTETAT